MPEKIPLRHIERPPLPWQTYRLTECGHDIAEFAEVLSRDEAVRQHKAMGHQRFGLITCMSCIGTANRWTTWDEDPVQRMGREFYMGRAPKAGDRFRRELLAIAALVDAHREEFDEMVEGLTEVGSLADVRAKHRYRDQAFRRDT